MDKEQRAQEAHYILTHVLVREALDDMRKDIMDKLESCPLRDRDGQHELTILLQILKRFEQEFKTHIETGALEVKERSIIDSANAYIQKLVSRQ